MTNILWLPVGYLTAMITRSTLFEDPDVGTNMSSQSQQTCMLIGKGPDFAQQEAADQVLGWVRNWTELVLEFEPRNAGRLAGPMAISRDTLGGYDCASLEAVIDRDWRPQLNKCGDVLRGHDCVEIDGLIKRVWKNTQRRLMDRALGAQSLVII